MDPIDILGSLLGGGKNKGSGGGGGSILTDLLGGGRKPAPTPPRNSGSRSGRRSSRPEDLDSHARQLEDLLGVAKDRYRSRGPNPTPTPQPRPAPQPPSKSNDGFQFDDRAPVGRKEPLDPNEEAIVLIRAMINAAKSDGRITRDEQQEILGRVSNASQEAMQFLQNEFSRDLDVREFAWSVPIGMEQKVYTMSLAAIELDAQSEASYLRDLAHGLRLDPDYCNDIHARYGAPTIY